MPSTFQQSITHINHTIQDNIYNVHHECHTRLLSHGKKTDIIYVLLHGLTNSPYMWHQFENTLFNSNANVYIPRLPYHGLKSLHTKELSNIKVKDLTDFALQTTKIATNLGHKIVLVGFSGGGTIASWMLQNNKNITDILLISPFFGIGKLPNILNYWLYNTFSKLPNFNLSFVSSLQSNHNYKGQSTKGLTMFLKLSHKIITQSKNLSLSNKKITLLLNPTDTTINNKISKNLLTIYKRNRALTKQVILDKDLHLPHDFIDTMSYPNAPTIIYPQIYDLLLRLTTTGPTSNCCNG